MAPYEPIWWARADVEYEDEKRRDQFVALPESLAKTALSWRAVFKVTTWGELRAGVEPAIVAEILEWAVDANAGTSPPVGQDPFDISEFGPYQDVAWPPDPHATMLAALPAEIVDNFGTVERTTLHGDTVRFPGRLAEAICDELVATGYAIEDAPELAEVLQDPRVGRHP